MIKNIKFLASILLVFSFLSANTQEISSDPFHINLINSKYADGIESIMLSKELNSKLKKDFKLSHNSPIKVSSIATIEDEKLIEGMETMFLNKVSIEITVSNNIKNEEWNWKGTFKGKGDSKKNSIKKALKSFSKKKSGLKDFSFKLNTYLQEEYHNNCNGLIDYANKQYNENNFTKSIMICAQIPKNSQCSVQAKNLKKKAFDSLQKKNCDAILYKATLKKSVKDYNGAIRYLIRISPDSPCASKALDLAKEMEDSINNDSKVDSKNINLYKIILESENNPDYKHNWLKHAIDMYKYD